ncbi:tRNA (adenosine(37)-N6)-threonylcarbamoyltransferase complex dimerization subunit type 1 TsaB [Phaeobacter gallaeciensis]|uniref:tRNA (Adenosine(37)-N6)-threonylcarbamoyltransferase complex dimerization subunit type 1 TsaB n=2 Tax=Roseobacteraceae TaxID=2854170 RepID=A0A366WP04_9RHOB|nr:MULTISPECIES: tRNA (adenosine(37)-N6)-threonylcarbamoyltransferase complex dimerization subunit type 1 TsaB [Roseobacteraceae]MBT3141535.1 tRNA (adenosine(37)-N6)-threonylcarbamoyltransferase complex dimerization subunit type 1 TsaB [Falsiruegeria litorea]MBT8167324.1 tRNA (adenosine(37)-N6)-threonylcarbamoyltransferase complex dimerization subunit type 1 TsaB [Falsiruegeria litorea]RBW50897.1 tRNA (adenosine(37)-N6)-threonylcarbamoyltransferase complex dimerization subunit type 1 TsaB [Phaeo
MQSDQIILAFDTSAAHCAAALLRGDEIVTTRVEEMSKGQAERLMPLLEEILTEADLKWKDLTALGVGIGPGNFTGIRISVSAARGLALGLEIPAVGVSGFEVAALGAEDDQLPAIPAPRDQVYVEAPDQDPALMPRAEAEALGSLYFTESAQDMIQAIARIAAVSWEDTDEAPAPLYVRPADAAPSRDVPPTLLDA